jgi:hypothetical protein
MPPAVVLFTLCTAEDREITINRFTASVTEITEFGGLGPGQC